MNRFCELILKGLRRKVVPLFYNQSKIERTVIPSDLNGTNKVIFDAILRKKPYMVARFGSVEICALANYVGVRDNPHSVIKYLKGEINEWWWSRTSINQLQSNAGFFPISENNIIKYGELMTKDAQEVDLLGSWVPEEFYFREELVNAKKVNLEDIKPNFFWKENGYCWTQALEGKRVLVVHPFVETIKKQYLNREKLFPSPKFLPEFKLLTVKSIQSIGGTCDYETWFDALDYMKSEMDKVQYDVCIIGCGAYGFCLAAHAKRTGHVAIHLGGITQLLFGIRGNRWDNRAEWEALFNEYWVRPSSDETPTTALGVEGACYW